MVYNNHIHTHTHIPPDIAYYTPVLHESVPSERKEEMDAIRPSTLRYEAKKECPYKVRFLQDVLDEIRQGASSSSRYHHTLARKVQSTLSHTLLR